MFALLLLLLGAPAGELTGLWKASRTFGTDARGTLVIQRGSDGYVADMLGRTLAVKADRGELSFALPDGAGSFRGRLQGNAIHGHWFRAPGLANDTVYASPVRLRPDGANRWRGEVDHLVDTFTLFLKVDGDRAFMSNPERDWGAWLGVTQLVRDDDDNLRLVARRRESRGTFDPESDVIALVFPSRGGTFDFRRAGDESNFHPRGKQPPRYVYRAPLARDDGWPTSSLDDVKIDRAAVETMVQMLVSTQITSPDVPETHALLVARRGKLVLEEYFHCEHRDKLHDTRSAAKSITAVVAVQNTLVPEHILPAVGE